MWLSIIALVISGVSLAISIASLKNAGNFKKETARHNEVEIDEAIRQLRTGLEESLVKTFDSNGKK